MKHNKGLSVTGQPFFVRLNFFFPYKNVNADNYFYLKSPFFIVFNNFLKKFYPKYKSSNLSISVVY